MGSRSVYNAAGRPMLDSDARRSPGHGVQIVFVSSWWMVAHIFFYALFCRNSFILIASSALSSPKASQSRVDRNSLCIHGDLTKGHWTDQPIHG